MAISEETITQVKQAIYADGNLMTQVQSASSLDEVADRVHTIAAGLGLELERDEIRGIFDEPASGAAPSGSSELSDEELEAVVGGKGGGGGGGCKWCLGTSGTYCIGTS